MVMHYKNIMIQSQTTRGHIGLSLIMGPSSMTDINCTQYLVHVYQGGPDPRGMISAGQG